MTGLMVNPPKAGAPSARAYEAERAAILGSLKARAERVSQSLGGLEGVTCRMSDGALYAFPKVRKQETCAGWGPETNGRPPPNVDRSERCSPLAGSRRRTATTNRHPSPCVTHLLLLLLAVLFLLNLVLLFLVLAARAVAQVDLPASFVLDAEAQGHAADELYCLQLLEATGVVVVPGSGFGQREGTWHFRTTFLPPAEKIEGVLQRLEAFHKEFMARHRQ